MDFIGEVRVSEERVEAGFGAEVDRAAAIRGAREIGWISIAENPSAEGNELWMFYRMDYGHSKKAR